MSPIPIIGIDFHHDPEPVHDPEWEAIVNEDPEYEDHKDDEPDDNGPTDDEIEEMEIEKQIEQQEMIDRGEI